MFFTFILITTINFSCSNDATQNQNTQQTAQNNAGSKDFSALATEYCTCSAELIALNKKVKYFATHPEENKNTEELVDDLAKSEQLAEKQIECKNRLEAQFQTKISENPDVLNAIRKVCPDLADFMENAKKNED
ncbi:MAG: hypothetical protein ACKVTZ_19085 [Bacteroidia bacterium]